METSVTSSKRSWLPVLIVTGVVGVSAGCSGAQGADGSGGSSSQEDVAATTSSLQACKSCGASDVTTFTANDSAVIGPLTSSHICFASEFQGRSSQTGAWLLVDKWQTASGEKWVVQGFGKMSCVPLCCFSHPSGSAVRWTSGTFATSSATGCPVKHTNMWWGDAGGWVQGVQKTGGSIEGFTSVDENVGAFTARQLHANNSCDVGDVTGWGVSFFVGVPSGGEQVELSSSIATWQMNPAPLIPATSGICYFTNVGAFLPGAGRKARIQVESGTWVLRAIGSSDVQAVAQCMYYRQ